MILNIYMSMLVGLVCILFCVIVMCYISVFVFSYFSIGGFIFLDGFVLFVDLFFFD